jgi:hypothetical protein
MRERRYHSREDDETYRFWSGVLLAIAICIPVWVLALYGMLALARRMGVIQ